MNVPGPGVFFEGAALGVTFFSSSMEIGWMGSTYLYEDQLQFYTEGFAGSLLQPVV